MADRLGEQLYRRVPADADLSYIAPALRLLAVPIGALQPDPRNAMNHPERNLVALVTSLRRYGQRKNLVANLGTEGGAVVREGGTLEAGHGTVEAARRLGWLYLAVVFQAEDERTARGFAAADNRTAQLSEWNEGELARWVAGDQETARAVGFDDDDLALLLGEEGQPEIAPWEMGPTRDRFCLTLTATLPLEAEVRRRLQGLDVEIEVSTLAL